MKKLILLITTTLIFSCVDKRENQLEKTNTNIETISSKEEKEISIKNKKSDDNTITLMVNGDGGSCFVCCHKWTYKYNEKGKLIEKSHYDYYQNYELDYKWTYKYDDKDDLITEIKYNSDGSRYNKWTYKYNNKGEKIMAQEYFYDVGNTDKKIYKYDDNNNLIEVGCYDLEGKFEYHISHKYDDKYRVIESKKYNTNIEDSQWSIIFVKRTYKYDEKDKMIELHDFQTDAGIYVTESSLYHGERTDYYKDFVSDDEFNLSYKMIYQYDSNGNIIKKQYDRGSGRSENCTYEYEYTNVKPINIVDYNIVEYLLY